MREFEEHSAREERIAEATPALGEALRDEDRAVALPDVSVGVAGTTMRESAKLPVQGAQHTLRVLAEQRAWGKRHLDRGDGGMVADEVHRVPELRVGGAVSPGCVP